ncbi:MAG: hypothetical protein V9G20_06195 [Candidatus Promineifilaceae bacterium]
MKKSVPVFFAVFFGLLTLVGLLFVPALGKLILGWASFLVACALLLGLGNLFIIHLRRALRLNVYSLALVLSLMAVLTVGLADLLGLTNEDMTQPLFELIQQPLETAFASLLAFFLLFAGFRLLQRRRDGWAVLFLLTVMILLLPLPAAAANLLEPLRNILNGIFVNAGLRGLLIGIALGTITLSLRLLVGSEKPYSE